MERTESCQETSFYETRKEIYDCHVWHHPNFPLHMHKHLEFAYNAGGQMQMTVGGREYCMEAGDCMLIFPYQLHSFSSEGEIDLSLIIADMDYVGEFKEELSRYELETPCFPKSSLSRYGQRILELVRTSAYDSQVPYQLDKGLLLVLLTDIFHHIPMSPRNVPADLSISQKLLQYVNEHIVEELTAAKAAKAMGISPYYLSRIFSEELKTSFPAYVAGQRLNLACNMLRNTQMSVTEITYEAGFPNMRTFHRCFRRQFGCTPTEWRSSSHS